MTNKQALNYLTISILSLFFTFSNTYSQPSKVSLKSPLVEPCFMENKTFQGGEEITYKLYYHWGIIWLSAGEVTFKVIDLGGQYHLSAVGKTYKSYEWFFKVRDYYDTYVDKNSLLPQNAIRNVSEGKYTMYEETTFLQDEQRINLLRGQTKESARPLNYSIQNCVHDILSVIYYTRNIDFNQYEVGDEFPVSIFMDKETWHLKVKYKGKAGRKKIKRQGRFDTLRFSPQLISGRVFKKGEEMNVYVTDDQNRIPVLIESPVSVGSVKAILKNYKGLKYEMTAKR